ncbi:MAG: cell envelope biogenesis protein TolA [Reyranella sp.]|nr:cell envelope biogenesis protein TolA [Reyranella sp.]
MARKLKTYTTSAGFFDLAVAAPSMKAALEAWGSRNNLFQHGFAKVSDDPKIVAATMAHPGVVLRRPVGTTGAFSEHAKLPTDLPVTKTPAPAAKRTAKKAEPPPKPVDDKAAREAASKANLAFEKEQKRRDNERRKEEAARQKERARRERAIAAAEAALEEGRREHEARREEIEKERAALDKRAHAEDARWRKKKDDLEADLRQARSASHLRLV